MHRRAIALAAGFLAAGTLFTTGCSSGQHNVQWDSEGRPMYTNWRHDGWNYQYVYFRDYQVYYEPYSGMYYWHENDEWFMGPELPPYFVLEEDSGRMVQMASPTPPEEHFAIARRFGPRSGTFHPLAVDTPDDEEDFQYADFSDDDWPAEKQAEASKDGVSAEKSKTKQAETTPDDEEQTTIATVPTDSDD